MLESKVTRIWIRISWKGRICIRVIIIIFDSNIQPDILYSA